MAAKQTAWWEYIGDGASPLPGFSPEALTDVELREAAERYAAHWPLEDRARAAELALAVVTGEGRLPAAYEPRTGALPGHLQMRADMRAEAAVAAAARALGALDHALGALDHEERAGLLPVDTGE